jgi:hypothetical protein
MQGCEDGAPAAGTDAAVEQYYRQTAEKVVEKMAKKC